MLQETPLHAEPAPKKGMGCFGIGCLIFLFIGLVVISIAGFWFWKVVDTAKEYTSTSPVQVVALDPGAGEYEAVITKVDAYSEAVRNGEPASLSLSEREFAVFMTGSPGDTELRETVIYSFVKNEDGQTELAMDASLPLEGVPMMSGRFLNARVFFTLENSPGGVAVFTRKVTVGDKELPKDIMESLASTNITEDLMSSDAKLAPLLRSTESVEFSGMNLEFTGKPPGSMIEPDIESDLSEISETEPLATPPSSNP